MRSVDQGVRVGVFSKIFGTNQISDCQSDSLVQRLVSNDESMFLEGLTEAVRLADSGELRGIEAMREAMRLRSGRKNIKFYEPGLVVTKGMERYTEARQNIVAFASKNALLDDVYASGDFITAFIQLSYPEELSSLLHEIYAVGGLSEGYAFQLLYNELRCTARFTKSLA